MSLIINDNRQYQMGFSLIELMVSLTIFSMVMTVSIGTLLVMLDANEKAQGEYYAMTNLTFAMDSMTREIRTGYDHYCRKNSDIDNNPLPPASAPFNRDCQGNNYDKEIVFTRGRDDARIAYRLNDSVGTIEQRIENGPWLDITSEDLIIERFDVRVEGSQGSNNEQTHVILYMHGYIKNANDTDTDFRLQTTITQRILNY